VVSGKPVTMLEKQPFTGAKQENAALLPRIAGSGTLAKAISHCLNAAINRSGAHRAPEAANKLEGAICGKVLADINFTRKPVCFNERISMIRAAAPDGNQPDAGIIQTRLNAHKSSHLLLGKKSAEVAEKRQQDRPACPEGFNRQRLPINIFDLYVRQTGLQLFVYHNFLLLSNLRIYIIIPEA